MTATIDPNFPACLTVLFVIAAAVIAFYFGRKSRKPEIVLKRYDPPTLKRRDPNERLNR